MSEEASWLVGRIAVNDLRSLAVHRARSGWACRDAGDASMWLRVPSADEERFARLPLLGRWRCDDDGAMVAFGKSVPEVNLPEGEWKAVSEVLGFLFPDKTAPGIPPLPVGFELVASDEVREVDALIGDWNDFYRWSERVLEPRVTCLMFAMERGGRVMVVGSPLPAISGAGFYKVGRLWLPCGFGLPAYVWPDLVERVLGAGQGLFAVLCKDGCHELLSEAAFVAGSRAAVRMSDERRAT